MHFQAGERVSDVFAVDALCVSAGTRQMLSIRAVRRIVIQHLACFPKRCGEIAARDPMAARPAVHDAFAKYFDGGCGAGGTQCVQANVLR
jgi:hypothetical protein